MRVAPRFALCAITLAALAGTAAAQDSVSINAGGGNGLPGDALSAFGTGVSQRANYVVDLTPFSASWGTPLGVAPIIKSYKVAAARFNAVNGPSCISATTVSNPAAQATAFSRWQAAGGGVSPTDNNPALNTNVTLPAQRSGFGVALLDFEEQPSGASLALVNVLTGAQVMYDPAEPTRLFVTRVNAALNAGSGQLDGSQFGLGAVDAAGSVVFRADSFGSGAAAAALLVGDNIMRIRTPARTAGLNIINNNGATQPASLDWPLVRSTMTTSVPSAIPTDLAGRSVAITADFVGQLGVETSPGTVTFSGAHRPNSLDHRGGPSFAAQPLVAGSVGAGGVLSRSAAGGGRTDSMSLFALSFSGAVVASRTLTMPASISDACDAFSWPIAGGDFRQYDSQAVFRGGSGPVAVGRDAHGRGLAAALVYSGTSLATNNPINALAAARFDMNQPGQPASWTVVAWVDASGSDGKDILGDYGVDGAPGSGDAGEGDGVITGLDAPIGRVASFNELGTGLAGPSLSAPAFDSAGNAYFTASVALKKRTGSIVVDEFQTALLRGVYDPATFCYRLELVLATGQTFLGQNSARNWRVAWLGVADADSTSSAALWSGSVSSRAWNDADVSALPPNAPQHLGGLVASARIVYDTNNDGAFEDPTFPTGNAGSLDEAYNVVLYVGNVTPPAGCDSIDFNQDGLFPDNLDLEDFLSVFGGGPCSNDPNCGDIDFNNDGLFPDNADLEAFFSVFGGGPC